MWYKGVDEMYGIKIRKNVILYVKYASICVRSIMQYKMSFFLMILGGTLLFIGLFMLGASFCFFTIEDTSVINVLTYVAKTHGKYPIDIYGKGIMSFCTYIIPYTLIQYYPLQYLLGKTTGWIAVFYPVGIIGFLAVCYGIWCMGVRNYKSCGSWEIIKMQWIVAINYAYDMLVINVTCICSIFLAKFL